MNASKSYSRPWSADPRGSSCGESLDARREQLAGAEPPRPTPWCTRRNSRVRNLKRGPRITWASSGRSLSPSSCDSRYWGTITRSVANGKVFTRA